MSRTDRRAVVFAFAALGMAVVAPAAASLGLWVALASTAVVVTATLALVIRLRASESSPGPNRPRWLTIAWVLILLLACGQMARLSAFMGDVSRVWGSTVPDSMAVHHACLAAYIEGAALSERHEPNLYDERWYPAYQGACGRPGDLLGVRKLGGWVSDPYLYPPPFLLVPRLVLAVTHDIDRIRTLWFIANALLLVGGLFALATWVKGRPGRWWLWLIPATLASPPTMLMLQFGQVHGLAVLVALAGMAAIASGADIVGPALLACAVLAKLTPIVLVVPLVAARQWRALAWTAGWVMALSAVSVACLGTEPFRAFLHYELPRLLSGDAFSFVDRQGSAFLVSRNFSIQGIGARLQWLGVGAVSAVLLRAVSMTMLALTSCLAWRRAQVSGSRASAMTAWLAWLNVATLCSPVAPSAYVTVPALWLVALLAGAPRASRWGSGLLVGAWALIVGAPPLPDAADLVVAGLGQFAMIVVCLWALARDPFVRDQDRAARCSDSRSRAARSPLSAAPSM